MMTDADVFPFNALTKRLGTMLGKRTDFDDFKQLTSGYFRALRHYDLADLERGADAWIARETRFPKAAEWAAAIPPKASAARVMSTTEASTWTAADQAGFEGDCCDCPACIEAGVNEKPLRFVPTEDEPMAMHPITGKLVTVGHWAHGFELFRWYDAKANFYDFCLSLGIRRNVLKPTDKTRKRFTQAAS